MSGSYLIQSGQPVTALSGVDSNDNGDAAGDRAILNTSGVGLTGTAVDFVCNDGAGGATRIVPQSAITNAGIPCGPLVSGAYTDANVVGYVAESSGARYVQAWTGAKTNIGRNTIPTPGLNLWNVSVLKNIALTERFSMQFRAEAFDIFNHQNFSIGLPTNNGALDSTTNPNPLSTSYPCCFLEFPQQPHFRWRQQDDGIWPQADLLISRFERRGKYSRRSTLPTTKRTKHAQTVLSSTRANRGDVRIQRTGGR